MDEDLEIKLIGLLIKQPDLLSECQKITNFENPFTRKVLSVMFDNIKKQYEVSGTINKRELLKHIHANNFDISKVSEVSKAAGFTESIHEYVSYVHENIIKRELQSMGNKIINCSEDLVNGAEDYLKIAKNTIDSIDKNSAVTTGVTIPEGVKQVLEKAIALNSNDGQAFIKTGIPEIDKIIFGFQTSTTSVIAARPAIGKTALALTILRNMTNNGVTGAFLSLEMGVSACCERLIQVESDVSTKVFANNPTQAQFDSYQEAANKLSNQGNIYIERTTDRNIGNIRSILRRLKNRDPELKIVFIDYIQKIRGDNSQAKCQEIGDVAEILTDIATDLDIHICALAQVNREGTDLPKVRNIKDSGTIEQEAHIIMLIHRDIKEQYAGDDIVDACVYVAKNRDGAIAAANIHYKCSTTKYFSNNYNYEEGL